MGVRVVIRQTAQSFDVDDNHSMLDAALRQGVQLAHEANFGGFAERRRAPVDVPFVRPRQTFDRVALGSGTVDLNQRVWMTSRNHGEGPRACELML